MFGLLRWVFVLVGVLLIIVLINKSSIKRKKPAMIISIIVLICLETLCSVFPVENLFIHFSSPQKAFEYAYRGEITNVIEGQDSTLVLYKDEDSEGICILPKSEKGWQINTISFYNKVYDKKVKEYSLEIYHAKNTEDYYVLVYNWFAEEKFDVSDNRDTHFLCIENVGPLHHTKAYDYYGYVDNIEDDYEIQIGDDAVSVYLSKIATTNFWKFIIQKTYFISIV